MDNQPGPIPSGNENDQLVASNRVGTYSYQGIQIPRLVMPEILHALHNTFQYRPEDIFIVTAPKSGTHWTTEIVGLILADGDVGKVRRETFRGHFEFALADTDATNATVAPKLFYQEVERATHRRVMFTHLPMRLLPKAMFEANSKVIYVARNPKDCLASYHRFQGNRPETPGYTWDWMVRSFFTDQYRFGAWHQHVLPFWERRHEENILFLKYEDMKTNPSKAVSTIARFIDHDITDETAREIARLTSLESLKNEMRRLENSREDGYLFGKMFGKYSYFQKGLIGDWKNHFTTAQIEEFDKEYERHMKGSGLTFRFE